MVRVALYVSAGGNLAQKSCRLTVMRLAWPGWAVSARPRHASGEQTAARRFTPTFHHISFDEKITKGLSGMETSRTEAGYRSAWKAVFAGGFGNVLEQYDNLIYAYSAATLGALFFPSSDPTASLVASFGAFAAGFLVRPLGALIFGWTGDRFGRRLALVLSVAMMALCTTLIGALPTYATLGVGASVMLLILRLLQGLSVGGEWAGSTAFIVE
jgi:hypothetical protein